MGRPEARKNVTGMIEWLILVNTLFIANRFTWLCPFEINKPTFWCENGTVAGEFFFYMALAAAVLIFLHGSPLRSVWERAWRRNAILALFLLVCLSSTLWSESAVHTLYRFFVVLFSAIIASYLGIRYRDSDWIRIIAWFTGVTVLLSFLLVWLLPGAAIMSTLGLVGAWRGAFSHKNYAGSIVAYGASVLALAFFVYRRPVIRILVALLFAAAVVFIYLTRSATGVLVLAFQLALLAALLMWRRFRESLRRPHYLAFAGILLFGALLAILFRDAGLGLLGRNASLTGRIPLWVWVIAQVRHHNVWFGYGLWTVWRFPEFTTRAGIEAGWPYPIIDSHNGYLDVLLYLGVFGLTVFLALVTQTVWRAASHLWSRGDLHSFWMVMTVGYVLVANLTVSFFFQFETFHWLLLVAVLFGTSLPRQAATPAASMRSVQA